MEGVELLLRKHGMCWREVDGQCRETGCVQTFFFFLKDSQTIEEEN